MKTVAQSISLTLCKGQSQIQVRCHHMKMLHGCRVTQILGIIWEAELRGDIHL